MHPEQGRASEPCVCVISQQIRPVLLHPCVVTLWQTHWVEPARCTGCVPGNSVLLVEETQENTHNWRKHPQSDNTHNTTTYSTHNQVLTILPNTHDTTRNPQNNQTLTTHPSNHNLTKLYTTHKYAQQNQIYTKLPNTHNTTKYLI